MDCFSGLSCLFEQIKSLLDDISEKLPDEFSMHELQGKVPPDERTPYTIVAFQECERMNTLTNEMKRSLKELDLGLKVRPVGFVNINSIVKYPNNSCPLSFSCGMS